MFRLRAGGSSGQRAFRLCAAGGIIGPAAFTAAWVAASLRQAGYSPADIQLSGLAAPDARDPWIMLTGFIVLGGCTVAFGSALNEALGGARRAGFACRGSARAGEAPDAGLAPWLIQGAGLLTIAAGLLRRDHMLLGQPPGGTGESWHNHAHDLVSAALYAALVSGQCLLALRFGPDDRWRPWRPWLAADAAATAIALIMFRSGAFPPWDGILQRTAVTLPLAMVAAIASRLLRPRNPAPPGQRGRLTAQTLLSRRDRRDM
jgi:hypothetical protein